MFRFTLKLLSVVVLVTALSSITKSQPSTLWTQTYGGDQPDEGRDVIQATDNTFVVAGFTFSFSTGSPQADVYLLNIGVNGDTLWTNTFGGTYYDRGNALQQTWDAGYIVAGETSSYGAGEEDFYLVKVDQLGGLAWENTYGSSEEDVAFDVQQTSDGGYVMVGITYANWGNGSDILLVKTDAYGVEEWSYTYGGEDDEEAYGVRQTPDDGFIVAGYSSSNQPYGVYLVKTDALGGVQWSQSLGGGVNARCYDLEISSDGGFIIVGSTTDYGAGAQDIYLIKTNANGDTLWTHTYGDIHNDYGYDVEQTVDGGYIITGSLVPSTGNDERLYILKSDDGGSMEWDMLFGEEDYHHFGYGVEQTADGDYIITGKADPLSSLQYDVYLIRLDNDAGVIWHHPYQLDEFKLHSAFPNPFNPTTTISFQIPIASVVNLNVFDINGSRVGVGLVPTRHYPPGAHQITFDGTGLSSGIYIYRLTAGDFTASGKMVLMK